MADYVDIDGDGEEAKPKKLRKPRTPSNTDKLAKIFVEDYLKQDWDYRTGRRWLHEAAEWVNPPKEKNARAYPLDMILGCLKALGLGMFGFKGKIQTLRVLGWGTPPYIEQYEKYIGHPPPAINKPAVKQWEELTGRTAYPAIAELAERDTMDGMIAPDINQKHTDFFNEKG